MAKKPFSNFMNVFDNFHNKVLICEIIMFCSEVIMIKIFKPIKTRRPWLPIRFHIFFSKTCFSFWSLLVFFFRNCIL